MPDLIEAAYLKRFLRLSAWYLAGGSGVHGGGALQERGPVAARATTRGRRMGKRWAVALPNHGRLPARLTGCRSAQRCQALCYRKQRGLAQRGSA